MGVRLRIPRAANEATDEEIVLRFLRGAASMTDLETLTNEFAGVASRFGFEYFMCAYIASPGRPVQPQVLFGRPHLPSAEKYMADKLAAHDPVVQHIFTSPTPFTWEDVRQRPLTPPQQQVFDNAAAHGLHDGLVIPIHGASGDIWSIVLVSEGPVTLDRQARASITAAATLYAVTGATLAELQQDEPTSTPLTKRETQCLAWAAQGKTDWEIGQLLQIGDKTVNMHIDNARKKLDATSRAQAALIAWRRGWLLDYPD